MVSRISLFGGTSEAQLAEILRRLEVGKVQAGQCVFKKGDEPYYIYIVKSGKLDLLLCDEDLVLEKRELSAGECFGEASIMSMHKHTATTIAKEDSEILVLSRDALIHLGHEDIDLFALLMMNIARELARRLQLTDGLLLHYLRERGDKRE